ncbi:hypothetical protein M413DRAFT_445517 [Hebeloma cylindrosporum]|uniref:Hemerythrin-like domain-containing protein n=1 Tax=Hebeloma cylindrosporum TaxID=76867 RepID=A0A0C3CBE1_HEBCY|nr:hypothetical protein M413DRAFT_445517 [Hebeloma cylindrosporum h7]
MSTENAAPRFPLIPITYSPDWDYSNHVTIFSIEMTMIHNVFIRGLNSIYENAPSIPASSSDVIPFVGYALAWVSNIHDHHHGEEDIVFPFLQENFPDDMHKNIEEHKTFRGGLDALEEYLKAVQQGTKGVKWDGEKVKALIEAFGDGLVEHLHEEIPTISPERLSQVDHDGLAKMVAVHNEHIKNLPMATAHVHVFTHHDFETYPSWPPLPAPVSWFVRNVLYFRRHSFWKFAPYSRTGKPQTYVAPSQ